jgi:hypothetical protein
MKYKMLLLLLCCTLCNSVFAKDKSFQKYWIKHHYECVSPYLEEIKATKNYDRVKNRNQLVKVIDNLEVNYKKVYSKNRTKHYIKQARELKNRSHKLYQDQIWYDKENANINLYVPEYCFTMLDYQLKEYHKANIEKYFMEEDYKIEGFEQEAQLLLAEGLIGLFSLMTDAMYSNVSIDSYRDSLKDVLGLTYPVTYAKCYDSIEYSDPVYQRYNESISRQLYSEYESKLYQERLFHDKRKLEISFDVLINHTGVKNSDIKKNYISVSESHEFFKLKEKQLSDLEGFANSANKLVNELANLKYIHISHMSKYIKNNPSEFSKFKDEYVCSAVARVHRNNGYLDGYITPREMKKYHRDYYKSIR